MPLRLFALLALFLLLPPPAPQAPHALVLDGFRDSAYVLVADDPPSDLAPAVVAQARYRWADLTRLYVATDATHLYVYAELLQYTQALASGDIGLAIVKPDGAALGPRTDPLRPQAITYDYTAGASRGCGPASLSPTRHPDVLIRGLIAGTSDGDDTNSGFTFITTGGSSGWGGTFADWGGLNNPMLDDRLAYANGEGVEFHIPWADLGLTEGESFLISFFTSTANSAMPASLDAIPSDLQAAAAPTSTVLSQLANVAMPLPAPASVSLTCNPASVAEGAGAVNLTAQLHTALTQAAAVNYTASALTAGPADFAAHTGTLNFPPLVTQLSFSIPVTDDTLLEGPETFLVTLSNPYLLTLTPPTTTTVTIEDNDVASLFKLFIPFTRR